MERKLESAEKLLKKLSEEQTRWKGQTEHFLFSQKQSLPISILLAAYVHYLSSKSFQKRRNTIKVSQNRQEINMADFRSGRSGLKWKTSTCPL